MGTHRSPKLCSSVKTDGKAQNGDVVQTYEYEFDDFSNRTELIASGDEDYTATYWYDANNRLLESEKDEGYTETVTEYSYDDNGNQVEKEVWIDNSFDSSETSVYNGFNQLVSVSNDDVDAEYTYAPSGLRLTKTVDNEQIYYINDGDNVIAELYEDEVTAYYLRGRNLYGSFIGNDEYFYLYNAHGDVVNLTDTSGYIEHTYRYDAFGNEREPESSDNNPFRYCGEYYDGETGSYYLRARYYDPVIGRFTQEDNHWNNTNRIYDSEDAITILVIQQSGNLYSYCVCNPLFFIDESGLNVVPFWGVIHSAVQSHIKMKHPTYFLEQKIAYKGTPFYGRADVISPDGQVWEIKSERILSDPEKRVAAEQQLIKYVNNEWVNGEVPLSVATSTLEGAFKLKTRYVNYNVEYHTIGGGLISYSYDYDFVEEQAVEDISTAVIIGGYIAVFLMSGGTIQIPGFAY